MRATLNAGAMLFVMVLTAVSLRGQAPNAKWAPAVRAFDSLMRVDSAVGGTLVYLRDGREVSRHDAGFADRAGRVPVSPRTIYHWGSITKTLTATAILQLRDRGLLTLDDPVTRWVPELRQVHNPYGSMDAITLRMLLSHSAGFQNPTWPYTSGKAWEPFEPTRWEQLVAMMPYQEVLFQPGSRYSYSNPGFIYLARVIEAITGDPWQSYIYKNLWGPLGLRESYFNRTPWHLAPWRSANYTLRADSAGGEEVRDNGREFDPGITIPNGGWNAPVRDLAVWASFLAGATADSLASGILPRATLEEMWKPIVPSGDSESVGLGFFLVTAGGTRLIGHTGEQAGFRSCVFVKPKTRAAVVGVVNTTNDARPDESGRAFRRAVQAAWAMLE